MYTLKNIYLEEANVDGADAGITGDAPEPLLDAPEPDLAEGEYLLTEGIKGTGETPEWYKADKYKSVAEQARAYSELEKKFGAFTGTPKDGYTLPEAFDADDELAKEVIKFGEETNLSQEGFNKLMELAAAQAGAVESVSREAEMAKLGDDAGRRIKQVEAFLKNKAGDQYQAVSEMVIDANSVMLVEKLMEVLQPPKLPIDGVQVDGKPTWEEIEREMYRKDDHGQLLRSVDRAHEMKIQRMMKEFGGDKPNQRIFG